MIDHFVTGAGGALGSVLMRVLSEERRNACGLISMTGPSPDVGKFVRADLTEVDSYRDRLFALAPRVVVHLAAVSRVSDAYRDPDRARAVNVDATVQLLELTKALGARFVYASTDQVFDGDAAPYDESVATEPCSFYGRTKLEAECHVLAYKRGLVLRFPLLYGFPEAQRPPTFFENMLTSLREGRPVQLFEDEVRTPLWLDDAAHACLISAQSELTGVVHLGGPERLSRLEMGRRMVAAAQADERLLVPMRRGEHPSPEPRPHDVSLSNRRYQAQFGKPVGQPMQQALRSALLRGPSRLLS
jgi:dTDP-4-dehydrorhamnose reductase